MDTVPAPDRHLKTRIPRLQAVLRRDRRAVAEPLGDHVGGQGLGPVDTVILPAKPSAKNGPAGPNGKGG